MATTVKIYGPPGTGKTRNLLDRFEQEVKKGKVALNRVAFLTFTRAARREAIDRIGKSEDQLPFVRTIHAICYRQLGITQGQIVKPKDLRDFGKVLGIKLSGSNHDPWELDGYFGVAAPTRDDMLLQLNHLGRHRLQNLNDSLRDADLELDLKYAKWFTLSYRDWKRQEALLDYTDLLTEYLKYGEPLPIDVLFVDEAQDLSRLQWQVVHRLGANASRVYLAGDDDQAIFAWAGASADAFIDEPADEVLYLNQSNRVPERVYRVASSVIQRISRRAPKSYEPKPGEAGEVDTIPYIDEEYLQGPSTFVMFRNHHRGRELKEKLEDLGHPFVGENSILSDVKVRKVIEGWVDLHSNDRAVAPPVARALIECASPDVLNKGMVKTIQGHNTRTFKLREIFAVDVQPTEFFKVLTKIPGRDYLMRTARNHGFRKLLTPTTTLLSIHQSKGREADTVILDTEVARKTYDAWWQNPEDEHRVWYVGVTRSMRRLLTLMPEGTMVYPL